MSGRNFEDVLAECLQALEDGAAASQCLARYPEHADRLRPVLEIRERLAGGSAFALHPEVRARGLRRLRAALAEPATTGGPFMIPQLAGRLHKAVTLTLAGLVLTGGAIGASAGVGGPNLPSEVLQAVGLQQEDHGQADPENEGKGKARGLSEEATGTATASAHAEVTGTPSANSIPGLCNAYARGSENGQDHKRDSTAFQRLANAAEEAGEDVDEFCEETLEDEATAEASATASATAESKGKALGKGKNASANADADNPGKGPKSESDESDEDE